MLKGLIDRVKKEGSEQITPENIERLKAEGLSHLKTEGIKMFLGTLITPIIMLVAAVASFFVVKYLLSFIW